MHKRIDHHRIRHDSCVGVVALSWRGSGRLHGRNHGFPKTTVHQFLWPGQRVDTGGGALTTQGKSVVCVDELW